MFEMIYDMIFQYIVKKKKNIINYESKFFIYQQITLHYLGVNQHVCLMPSLCAVMLTWAPSLFGFSCLALILCTTLWVSLPHFYLFAVSGSSLLTISACYWPCSCFIPRLTLCVDWSPEADLCLSDYYHHPLLSRPNARLEIQSSLQTCDVLCRSHPKLPWHQIRWCIRFTLMRCISDHWLYVKWVRLVLPNITHTELGFPVLKSSLREA